METVLRDLDKVVLTKGGAGVRGYTMCVNNIGSWLAGEPHSDAFECSCRVLRAFSMCLNDTMPDDMRQRLKPFALRMINTRDDGHEEARRWMAVTFAVTVAAPAALRAAGMNQHADRLEAFGEVGPHNVRAASAAASAAESAAESAAYAAASAAESAAESAAYAAASAAAYAAYAAHALVWEQALELMDRMCALGEEDRLEVQRLVMETAEPLAVV